MRRENLKLLDAQSLGASFNSAPILLEHIQLAAIQIINTGTPSGEFKLQGSCTPVEGGATPEWSDISGTVITVSAAGDILYNITDIGYDQMRVVYTRTGGTGACTARAVIKGF